MIRISASLRHRFGTEILTALCLQLRAHMRDPAEMVAPRRNSCVTRASMIKTL